jgi:hypothetical protein
MGMLRTSRSVRGNSIALTAERWVHIVERHEELAGHLEDVLEVVTQPEAVYEGSYGESLAVKAYDTGIWLVAVYIDETDGFIVTAFLTSRRKYFEGRHKLWP